ncbi:MAG: ATP-dependent sacrificial sulfur transferase LarE [Rubripirellula sp.]
MIRELCVHDFVSGRLSIFLSPSPPVTCTPELNAERLIDALRPHRRVAVAFSGGIDSSVVAAAAQHASLDWVCAVTADSPSVPRWQVEIAKRVASEIGIPHRLIGTEETSREDYRRNDSQRCFFCKETLYAALERFCADEEAAGAEQAPTGSGRSSRFPVVMVSGTNADDLGDHRPGIEAGRRMLVRTPLADLQLTKKDVRDLGAHFGLTNHQLPASPCLASRIAYGVEVTLARLQRVEQAEDWLRSVGFSDCRVRLHPDEMARIEVPRAELARLFELSSELTPRFRDLGFQFVTMDLEGFQSGKMNRVVVPLQMPVTDRSKETVH